MKKIIIYTILFFAILTLHIILNTYFSFFGIAPNIILLAVIYLAISKGPKSGMWAGFLLGLAIDVILSDMFGSRTIALTIIGYSAGFLSGRWDNSNWFNQTIIIFLFSFVYLILLVLEYAIFSSSQVSLLLNHITLLQPIFNAIVSPIVFLFFVIFLDSNNKKYGN